MTPQPRNVMRNILLIVGALLVIGVLVAWLFSRIVYILAGIIIVGIGVWLIVLAGKLK